MPQDQDEFVTNTLNLLGKKARDKVSGYAGVISSVSFDLYGCTQLAISPPVHEGKHEAGHYFDVARVEITDHVRVMPVPNWQAVPRLPEAYPHGASDKPPYGERT